MEGSNNLIQQESTTGSRSSTNNITELSSIAKFPVGGIRIGKIEYEKDRVLGKGCDGTSVFYGRFEGKPVAVKRLLSDNVTDADIREIDLLRESDEHPNVIRYFCNEMDEPFIYIAIELCNATLEDYVLGKYEQGIIKDADILKQATSGLAHLHFLNIVHRDIKPHNILLSVNCYGHITVKLSDFGYCKKLKSGQHSVSQTSGIKGTAGWMAPEIIQPNVKPTFSVDIFSMGCLFYYILSKGKHPFGDIFGRQEKIIHGVFSLEYLNGNENVLAYNLISAMISHDPNKRPNATTVLKHPFFWDATRVLTFFQEVSDFVSDFVASNKFKENDFMKQLEYSDTTAEVVRKDWIEHIHGEVAFDLRKHGNYQGQSVKDLLRVIRNKKHHYRDLTEVARKILGESPEQFLQYWTSRFPLLLIHSWLATQCVKHENLLKEYYDPDFTFRKNYSMSLSDSDRSIADIVEEPLVTPICFDKIHKNNVNNVDSTWNIKWRDIQVGVYHGNIFDCDKFAGDGVHFTKGERQKDHERNFTLGSILKSLLIIYKTGLKCKVSCQNANFGIFDDFVVEKENSIFCIQFKSKDHSADTQPRCLEKTELFPRNKHSYTGYAVLNYCESFVNNIEKFTEKSKKIYLILWTNRTLDSRLLDIVEEVPFELGSNIHKFKAGVLEEFINKSHESNRKKLNDINTQPHGLFKTFEDSFYLAFYQEDKTRLDDKIKSLICEVFDEQNCVDIFNLLIDELSQWYKPDKDGIGNYLSYERLKHYFDGIEHRMFKRPS